LIKSTKKKILEKIFPVKPPLYADKFLNKFLWHKPGNNNVYLTFDDGPTPIITEKVLNILEKKQVKATFFCLGRNIDKNPQIYNDIITKGHSVGNHTYSHLNGWKTKYKEYINDVDLASNQIKSKLFRPPYGKIKPFQLLNLSKKYKIVMWDVLSGDFSKNIDKETCLNNVVNYASDGSIIVFHDSIKASENMLYALPLAIDNLKNKGYNFDVIYGE
jgi:peptidoglycan/xylan/chitin deacetylase (PgdA/CDA1 family)